MSIATIASSSTIRIRSGMAAPFDRERNLELRSANAADLEGAFDLFHQTADQLKAERRDAWRIERLRKADAGVGDRHDAVAVRLAQVDGDASGASVWECMLERV